MGRCNTKYIREIVGNIGLADELDRLYALEDATTPFASRAEVETYLKGKGWKCVQDGENQIWICTEESGKEYSLEIRGRENEDVHIWGTFMIQHAPLLLLTPALLDKILEAK